MTEPYAWVDGNSRLQTRQTDIGDIPLYRKPQWRGLTLADIDDLEVGRDWIAGARWAEAKLEEKNGG